MIESPTKPVAASPDDRPIVVGRVEMPDFYVLAHEAKNRGCHLDAALFLRLAAQQLSIYYGIEADPFREWDWHIEAIDKAWGEKHGRSTEAIEPAANPVQIMRFGRDSLFIDAVMSHENGRFVAAAALLRLVAELIGFDGDWSGSYEEDWIRNFEGVHRSWLEFWSQCDA